MRRCCTVCFWPPLCLARRTMPSSKSIVAIAFAVLLILVTVVPALAFGSCNTWSLTSTYFDLPDEGIAILYVPLASLPLSRRERKFVFDFQPVPLLQCLFLYPRRFSHGSSCWSSQQSHLIRIELQVLFHSSSCSMAERKVSNLPVLRWHDLAENSRSKHHVSLDFLTPDTHFRFSASGCHFPHDSVSCSALLDGIDPSTGSYLERIHVVINTHYNNLPQLSRTQSLPCHFFRLSLFCVIVFSRLHVNLENEFICSTIHDHSSVLRGLGKLHQRSNKQFERDCRNVHWNQPCLERQSNHCPKCCLDAHFDLYSVIDVDAFDLI